MLDFEIVIVFNCIMEERNTYFFKQMHASFYYILFYLPFQQSADPLGAIMKFSTRRTKCWHLHRIEQRQGLIDEYFVT